MTIFFDSDLRSSFKEQIASIESEHSEELAELLKGTDGKKLAKSQERTSREWSLYLEYLDSKSLNAVLNSLLSQWLQDKAAKASSIQLTSYPPKFSHPDAKNVYYALKDYQEVSRGYICSTGNIGAVESDAAVNASEIPVYKFLCLEVTPGESVLDHLRDNTKEAQEAFSGLAINYDQTRLELLQVDIPNDLNQTSSYLSQVYWPLENREYHLLSLLTHSGILYRVRSHIDKYRYIKSKDKTVLPPSFATIGYGGTKPQNISVLNNRYGGSSYALLSVPPAFNNNYVKKPQKDLFEESRSMFIVRAEVRKKLERLLGQDFWNKERRERAWFGTWAFLVHCIMGMVATIQKEPSGWSLEESYSELPSWQKQWLDPKSHEQFSWIELTKRVTTAIINKLIKNAQSRSSKIKIDDGLRSDIIKHCMPVVERYIRS